MSERSIQFKCNIYIFNIIIVLSLFVMIFQVLVSDQKSILTWVNETDSRCAQQSSKGILIINA